MKMRVNEYIDNKMPSESLSLPTQTEKPHHYMYLKEFRTLQCPLFLQHKCTQHRPFTCFNWHFMNQRRRRPMRKRDGTFNYSPDIYCQKYDETTGLCPEGDDCPLLHRTAGDTERRYHLRYYKTGTCVHETDSKGQCVKNGPHCAFAHGAEDLRPPVYDVRELQAMETTCLEKTSILATPSSLEKERILNEDPRWNDTNYVLANYKTEQCKRPPRLCRQGYACPQYHNSRDRRRSPKIFKYRSTPCPNVKHGDEWGDPTHCESGDNCAYCHTRTEQQFHPEIYKSTKCNDMVQTSYCPRGPFCAFAHVEHEMTTQRELSTSSENSLAAFVTNALPHSSNSNSPSHISSFDTSAAQLNEEVKEYMTVECNNRSLGPVGKERSNSTSGQLANHLSNNLNSNHTGNSVLPEPIGKGRSSSTSSSITSDPNSYYQRSLGSDDSHIQLRQQLHFQQLHAIENDLTIDPSERDKRKQNLILLYNLSIGRHAVSFSGAQIGPSPTSISSSSMSPLAPSFYPPGDTVESVVGNALDDLNLDDFDITSIDREIDNDTNSVSSSLSASLSASGKQHSGCFGSVSGPVTIPHTAGSLQRGSVGSLSQSPPSPLGSFPTPQYLALQIQQPPPQQKQQLEQAFLSHANPGKFSAPAEGNMSPRTVEPHSPLYSNSQGGELQKIQEELNLYKKKLASWEDGYSQAKSACDAWKKEAEESVRKAKAADEDRKQIIRQRDEALSQLKKLPGNPISHIQQQSVKELENMPLPQLRILHQQLRVDMDRLEKIMHQHAARKCLICQDKNRNVVLMPCSHYVVCENCARNCMECPFCHSQVTPRTSLVVPM